MSIPRPGTASGRFDLPPHDTGPASEPAVALAAAAQRLVTSLTCEPWGQVSPSVYETARLVSLAPGLTGTTERIRYLLAEQRADGGWGGPGGYALVPTLSATEALLTMLRTTATTARESASVGGPASRHNGRITRHNGHNDQDKEKLTGSPGHIVRGPLGDHARMTAIASAARRGLAALSGWLAGDGPEVPDTPAADLIVPALIRRINTHLAALREAPAATTHRLPLEANLTPPTAIGTHRLDGLRRAIAAGAAVPEKLLHALEVVDDLIAAVPGIRPLPPGAVGAAPAATAAWLAAVSGDRTDRAGTELARAYLERAAQRHGGPVPCATPITVFERSWVLSQLLRARVPLTVPPAVVHSLVGALGPSGAATGPGLPTDADTTSVTLYALSRLGVPVDPECLWRYETESGFCTWPGEDGFSLTTNAHVLDLLGQHLQSATGPAPRYRAAVRRLVAGLTARQHADGGWSDRWHASPYYATVSCVQALAPYADEPAVAEALDRAVGWVVDTQRPDGSWGRWSGTVEETAYAMQVLLTVESAAHPGLGPAAARGHRYLMATPVSETDPPLWHDKDLYLPIAIVRAATLATLQMGIRRPDLIRPAQASVTMR
jgi:halimadienyl-diphosphate synthase